ncbi:Hypothetical predicted protein [Olea europaea subsp. europaea]|uniref:Uncharacterized protein n=1 Tax=Olea europaea subsp. europaea TaxID=158383 RepID=A0A8S0Q967_OLEEU|nr:Hypothetical predicted protein [Olea europaea subsp. europaea]
MSHQLPPAADLTPPATTTSKGTAADPGKSTRRSRLGATRHRCSQCLTIYINNWMRRKTQRTTAVFTVVGEGDSQTDECGEERRMETEERLLEVTLTPL